MGLRKHIPLFFAVVFASLASVSIYHYLKDNESVSIAKTDPMIQVVIAKHDLALGEKLTEEDLGIENWPREDATDEVFHSVRQLIGKSLSSAVISNEPITQSKIFKDEEAVAFLVPSEMRGVTVSVPKSDGLAKLLEHDKIVDVIAMFEGTEKDPGPTTKVIAHAARVLAVHNQLGKPDNNASPRHMEVTLIVTPQEAGWIIIAINKGNIHLVVRNASDQETISISGM